MQIYRSGELTSCYGHILRSGSLVPERSRHIMRAGRFRGLSPYPFDSYLIVVAGQSNVMGIGTSGPSGTGIEFRTGSSIVNPIADPCGYGTGNGGAGAGWGVFDRAQTGSMWPAFSNAFHLGVGKPIILIALGDSGTSIDFWNSADYPQAKAIIDNAIVWLRENGYTFQFCDFIWNQGETEAISIYSGAETQQQVHDKTATLIAAISRDYPGVNFNIIEIGTNSASSSPACSQAACDAVREAHASLAGEISNVHIIYTNALVYAGYAGWHYNQAQLDLIGTAAGTNLADLIGG